MNEKMPTRKTPEQAIADKAKSSEAFLQKTYLETAQWYFEMNEKINTVKNRVEQKWGVPIHTQLEEVPILSQYMMATDKEISFVQETNYRLQQQLWAAERIEHHLQKLPPFMTQQLQTDGVFIVQKLFNKQTEIAGRAENSKKQLNNYVLVSLAEANTQEQVNEMIDHSFMHEFVGHLYDFKDGGKDDDKLWRTTNKPKSLHKFGKRNPDQGYIYAYGGENIFSNIGYATSFYNNANGKIKGDDYARTGDRERNHSEPQAELLSILFIEPNERVGVREFPNHCFQSLMAQAEVDPIIKRQIELVTGCILIFEDEPSTMTEYNRTGESVQVTRKRLRFETTMSESLYQTRFPKADGYEYLAKWSRTSESGLPKMDAQYWQARYERQPITWKDGEYDIHPTAEK